MGNESTFGIVSAIALNFCHPTSKTRSKAEEPGCDWRVGAIRGLEAVPWNRRIREL